MVKLGMACTAIGFIVAAIGIHSDDIGCMLLSIPFAIYGILFMLEGE